MARRRQLCDQLETDPPGRANRTFKPKVGMSLEY